MRTKCVTVTLIQLMGWRYQSLESVAFDFGFLTKKKSSTYLALKYPKDLDALKLSLIEIASLRKDADYASLLSCNEEYGLVTAAAKFK